jgi:SAM-dependent methyltransferase
LVARSRNVHRLIAGGTPEFELNISLEPPIVEWVSCASSPSGTNPSTDLSDEYDRRKARHPYYHITEMLVLDYIIHHARCRVLEWGCGTGRHLPNLSGWLVSKSGFDQSESMVAAMTWTMPEWRAAHVATAGPTEPLPYPDRHFDVVVTVEALLHTRPEDGVGGSPNLCVCAEATSSTWKRRRPGRGTPSRVLGAGATTSSPRMGRWGWNVRSAPPDARIKCLT